MRSTGSGDELVVRIPRNRPELWSDLDDELTWLPRLAPRLPVRGAGARRAREADGGVSTRVGDLRVAARARNPTPGVVPESLAEELAEFIAALHAVDLAGGPESVRGDDLARFDEFTRANLKALEGELDTDTAEALWDEALGLPPWPHAPVWIHADLMPGNLLLDGGRLSAVIDWGGSGMGDPAVDLMVAWNVLDARGRAVFREAAGGTWPRLGALGRAGGFPTTGDIPRVRGERAPHRQEILRRRRDRRHGRTA